MHNSEQQHWHNLIGFIILIGGVVLICSYWLKSLLCVKKTTKGQKCLSPEVLEEIQYPESAVTCGDCNEEMSQGRQLDTSHW